MKLLNIQTHDLAYKFFFSIISLIIPPDKEEMNPQIAREAALATAY
jgi:hypothetical protein